MGVYLYCLLPPGDVVPSGLLGLDDRPVRPHEAGRLLCWVSEVDSAPEPTLERVRRHNAVVEAALATGVTPLPLRFGQWARTPVALSASLALREDVYLQALERVAGAVEFGVRVLEPAREPQPVESGGAAASGTAYMQALAQRVHAQNAVEARGREIAARLRANLASSLREERIEPLPSRHGVVSLAHLVEGSAQVEYRAALETLRREQPDLRFLLTGPWPPYSFAP